MKKTEKIIAALLTIALGVLLIVLRGKLVSILMTVFGVGLIAFGITDLFNRLFPPAVVKLVVGLVVILCGWVIVGAVLYVIAALLIIAGILLLYEKIRYHECNGPLLFTLCEYAVPAVFLVIGTLLLFNRGNTANWVFILSGAFTVVEGGLLLVGSFSAD